MVFGAGILGKVDVTTVAGGSGVSSKVRGSTNRMQHNWMSAIIMRLRAR